MGQLAFLCRQQDPHKGAHTAVAIGAAEEPLGQVRVRTSAAQAERLLAWGAAWPQRTWAVEGAAGLGHLLAEQLVAAGERVLDVQSKLGARVRLLASEDTNKNDPSDARSVAIAALRSGACRRVKPDDHATVLKVWAKRHRDLGRTRPGPRWCTGCTPCCASWFPAAFQKDHRSARGPGPGAGHSIRCRRAGPLGPGRRLPG